MIVVDTSAILAIYLGELDADRFAMAIERDDEPLLSAASVLECSIVMRGRKIAARGDNERWLDSLIVTADIAIQAVTAEQVAIARAAYGDYGKGTGHRAQLNFGDCFAYALARAMDVPLLYKGDDFSHTDVKSAL